MSRELGNHAYVKRKMLFKIDSSRQCQRFFFGKIGSRRERRSSLAEAFGHGAVSGSSKKGHVVVFVLDSPAAPYTRLLPFPLPGKQSDPATQGCLQGREDLYCGPLLDLSPPRRGIRHFGPPNAGVH